MNYETALKLKNAGFPQKPEDLLNEVEYMGVKHTKPTEPTLEELIEACGKGYFALESYQGGWQAKMGLQDYEWIDGSTPRIAVANLWLALNEKKHENT